MSALAPALVAAAQGVLEAHRRRGTRVAMAESCTGGLVSAALTDIAGSSDVFVAGFVTYANEAKVRMVGVDPVLIELHGAVSEQVARAMAEGALGRAGADVAVAITGVAGPGGGSAAKPVGTVWFARADSSGATRAVLKQFDAAASRDAIRTQAALEALSLLSP
ncbi:CinA family protein [Sphingomicrobium astaxanthinifaciens]|uniref:CinA family protein n=1 Tax=Sphingomicrobium astaxanthinifaciens TaxID=1227949 RepID=UPI001FCB8A4E|nr:nicotinamide-nucleotide amidohydrolase family protein [Sphingomicrobium astaxanthinifaciens]MCJ7422388.1 nicotinamide-nucleotide amidohydrolase family protein [Sphingomicrobium astaxanthinifaciens]